MSELIPITATDNGVQAVEGRALHAFLEIGARYNDWFPRMIEYGFEQDRDYVLKNERVLGANGREYEQQNHIVTLDMAKEVSMIQRNEKGKQARQYFIEVEKRAKQAAPALPDRRALAQMVIEAEDRAAEQEAIARRSQQALDMQAPAVAKAQAHSASKEWKGRQEFAREVQHWGRQWGYNILHESVYELLRRKGMLVNGQRRDRNHATAQAEKAGWATTEKGTSEKTGKPWAAARLSPKGQDLAWKWINKAAEEYGAELNPRKEEAAA